MSARRPGRVVAVHGRHYVVDTIEHGRLVCFTRGKRSECACGDRVEILATAPGQGVIEALLPRDNLVSRSNAHRVKRLAANVDRLAIVVATEPPFSEELLGRVLVAAETSGARARIVLNKIDLTERLDGVRAGLALYETLGYPVHAVSVRTAPDAALATLVPDLAHGTTLLAGQSGMGKSSLLNLLVPDAQAATREISEALQTGKHTTTDARLYRMPVRPMPATAATASDDANDDAGDAASDGVVQASIVDTPGFQEFGLAHLTPGEIERAFPDLRPFLGQCRFVNCTHLHEPGCAVLAARDADRIAPRRYALFAKLTRESATFRDR